MYVELHRFKHVVRLFLRAELALDSILGSPGGRRETQLRSGWSGGGTLMVVARREDYGSQPGYNNNPYMGGRSHW